MADCDCIENKAYIKSCLTPKGQLTSSFERVIEVARTYDGGETEDIIVTVDNKEYKIYAKLKQIKFNSVEELPEVGSESLLYIVGDTIYLYNSETSSYERLLGNYDNVISELQKIVNDGFKSLDERLKEDEENISDNASNISDNKRNILQLQKENNTQNHLISQLRSDLDEFEEGTNNELKEIKDRLTEAEEDIVHNIADIADNAKSISELQQRATELEEKIPSQASKDNKLADKAFVNSTVQTSTANFRGSWDTWQDVPTNDTSYPQDYAGSRTPTTNDYLVVLNASDYTNNELKGTWRFKYTGSWEVNAKSGWIPEYQVNREPLTAAQIASLNSGITEELVQQINTNKQNISKLDSNKASKTELRNEIENIESILNYFILPDIQENSNKILKNKQDIEQLQEDVEELKNRPTDIPVASKETIGGLRAWIDEDNYLCFSTDEPKSTKTFAESDWFNIDEISAEISANNMTEQEIYDKWGWQVGDEKIDYLSDGRPITSVILDFNYEDSPYGGKVGISIGMKELLYDLYPMDNSSKVFRYNFSDMALYTLQEIEQKLPNDLQQVIKPATKKYLSRALIDADSISTENYKLWIPSLAELYPKTFLDECPQTSQYPIIKQEGTQYKYYQEFGITGYNDENIQKLAKSLSNGTGEKTAYYVRTPGITISDMTKAYTITTNGDTITVDSTTPKGISVCYCV